MAPSNTILLDVDSSTQVMKGIVTTGQNTYPGSLCQIALGGTIQRYHNPSSQIAPLIVAVENPENGGGVNDIYDSQQKVFYVHLRPGDLFLGRATAAAVEAGEAMGADTATGYFRPTTGYVAATTQGTFNEALVIVAEADASTSGGRLIKLVVK